tara:strand:- start:309 stop:1412 length:1104 start_codon:yes stop_codon:yes gene_type:complete
MFIEFPYLIYYLGLLIATIILSRFIFRKYISFAKIYNLTKASNERAVHKGNVFTGGGVVYAAVIMVAALILDNLDFVYFSNFSPIVATSILISILGFYDDFIEISPFNKYIVLTFLILMLLYANATLPIIQNLNGFLGIYGIGYIPGLLFTSFVYLSIMNAINLTDGIDGYLAIFSIFFFISLLYNFDVNQFYTLNTVSVIIIGVSIMFLRYNFSKGKKLFVGDAGSLFIGFWIATYLITYITSAPTSKLVNLYSIQLENIPIIAISMISIPVLDTLRVMTVRIISKKSPFTADRNHLHHILLDSGMTHLRTSLFLTIINWFNCIAIFLMEQNFNSKELTVIYIFISVCWYIFFEYINSKNISSLKG